ncbi:hypothetical protein ASE01_17185 [Nocardioides sp. Root190]|nr:hypothetical protein ASE01_17185 [Nocardioides sp. Root190]
MLLLEAGGRGLSPYLTIPAGRARLSDKYDWAFPAEPEKSLNGRTEEWESGKVLGGSSAINGMMWARPNADDLDEWAELGNKGWDSESMLPFIRRSESFVGPASAWRGSDGPQSVDFPGVSHPTTSMFIEASEAAGHVLNEDYNGHSQAGVALGQVTQKRGLRHSSARAYLGPARRRPNLKIVTGATVERIILEGNRAAGVEYTSGRRKVRSLCDREVVLSAGAVGSPALLMRSGIGPRDHLTSVGISAAVDLSGVGKNLQNHVYYALVFEVDVPTLNREFNAANVIKGGLDLVLRGTGSATSSFGHAVLFGGLSGERVDYGAIFSPFGIFARKENGRGRHKMSMMAESAITVRVGLLRARPRGEIKLQSKDPRQLPMISFEHLEDPQDVQDLTLACRKMREIASQPPLAGHVVRELVPGLSVDDDASWEQTLRAGVTSGKHYGGTCRMGVGEDSVVDPQLRVRGVDGLRVADMSITPVVPAANTYATALLIGEVCADLILGKGHAQDD